MLTYIMDSELRAISDATRRRILKLVWSKELTAGDIASGFDMSRPAVSQHLKVLLDSDLVWVRGEGTKRFYRANRESLEALKTFIGEFWDESLSRLKEEAEREQKRKSK